MCIFKFYLFYQGYAIFLTFVQLHFFLIKPSERGIIYPTVVKFLHTRGFMGIQHKMQFFQVKNRAPLLGT